MSERIRPRWFALVIAGLLAVALSTTAYLLVGAHDSLDDARRSRSAVCDAISARALLDMRTAAALYRAGSIERGDERLPGEALGVYVRNCIGGGEAGDKLADRLNRLVTNLHRARGPVDLEAVADALSTAPPNTWSTLRLPDDPAVAAETTHLLGWEGDEAVAKAKAHAEGKGVMVFVTATWCVPCQKLEQMLGAAEPYEIMSRAFIPLRVDVTTDDSASAAARARYQAEGSLPKVQFLDLEADRLVPVAAISEDTPNYLEVPGLEKALTAAVAARAPRAEGTKP